MIEQDISIFAPLVTGHLNELKLLLAEGSNPNQVDSANQTPLMIAINKGHYEVVKLLLENGANPNMANVHGQTPLFLAANEGRADMVSELLKHGANPNQQTRFGNTPLYISAVGGDYPITKLLLQQEDMQYSPTHPYFIILKRLNAHALILTQQAMNYTESNTAEEARHDKIEFLILLMEIIKQHEVSNDDILTAVFNLEKRFQEKIFFTESHTQRLFETTLRCIYTGSTYSFDSML